MLNCLEKMVKILNWFLKFQNFKHFFENIFMEAQYDSNLII